MTDNLSLALEYYSCGFSTFPLAPKTKRPLMKWKRYQTDRADKPTIVQWYTDYPDAGVAVIAGEISGGLVVLDVDHWDFSKWLEERVEARDTWVGRTGSGKIHVYLRSRERCVTTELHSDSEFLADIRGDGQGLSGPSYLAAPATIHPATERPYETLFGDPRSIRTVDNAHFLYTEIGRKFAGTARLTMTRESNAIPAEIGELPSVTEAQIQQKLKAERGITGKIRRAIERDAVAKEGEWAKTDTHSDIDFAVTCALLDCDWTNEEIQAMFQYFPLGANHYRNPARPGRDYLARTLGKAKERVERSREAARVAEGENFKIQRVVKVAWDDPKYDVYFVNEVGQERRTTIDHDDLFAETGFRKKLAKSMSVLPVLRAEHSGTKKRFEAFSNILLQMASVEDIPEAATTAGHFRTQVRDEIQRAIRRSRNIEVEPDRPEEFDILWANETHAYVRGHRLVNEIGKVMRADPPTVWEAIKSLGGEPRTVTYGDNNKEEMWIIPRTALT